MAEADITELEAVLTSNVASNLHKYLENYLADKNSSSKE